MASVSEDFDKMLEHAKAQQVDAGSTGSLGSEHPAQAWLRDRGAEHPSEPLAGASAPVDTAPNSLYTGEQMQALRALPRHERRKVLALTRRELKRSYRELERDLAQRSA